MATVSHQYNAQGPAGLADRRHANPGQPTLVSPAKREELRERLAAPPPDGGLWTGPKVAAWLTQQLGRPISSQRAWEALQRTRFSLQQPRPQAMPPSPSPRRPSKRGLADAVKDVRTVHPDPIVTVWAEDEHRLELIPIQRQIWAPIGQRPLAPSDRRYQWVWVYAIVRPTTGQSWWCLLPTISAAAVSAALAAFAQDEGIDATHRVVLVWDGAGGHTSTELVVPDGIDLVRLPQYSPELQPAERVWPLVNKAVANQAFPDPDALEDVLVQRCRTLRADRTTI